MKNLILKFLLSAMTVSLGAFCFCFETREAKAMTVQEMIAETRLQQYFKISTESKIGELENIHEIMLEKASAKMEVIDSVDDKKEWFIAYKSIIEEYSDFIDAPETIYDCFTEKELELLFCVVQAEIGDSYSFEQKTNVASVIFNRIEHERFPDSLEEILVADQFATISDGRYKEVIVSEDTILACEYAFQIEDTTYGCLFFDSNNKLKYKFMFSDGAHNFYTLHDDKKERGELILLQE